jgi:putative tricarboxylic transport membrane protein
VRGRRLLAVLLVAAVPALSAAQSAAPPAYNHLRLIAPAAPGGGWDQTARAMQQALQQAGLVHTSSVENIAGAAGTIGLARFVSSEGGNGDVAMISGLIMLAAVVTHHSPVTLREVTPIARLTGEYEVIVVPASSPFASLADLLEAFKRNPESISWGGGSAGGTDQILAGLVADAAGVSPRRVNYIAFSGGGESMSAILGGQVSAGVNGLAEFAPQIEAGTVRVLGISSAERLPSLDAPTLREQGIDVVLENWRSIVAPPGINAEQRRRLASVIRAMVQSPAWREILARYRWNDRYLDGEPFATFTASEEERVRAILTKLGTGNTDTASWTSIGVYPLLVLTSFAAIALALGVSTAKSGGLTAEAAGAGWRALLLIGIGIVLDLVLLERAGFVVASTVLFWLTARAFDATHPLRDGLFAVVLSVAVYVLFVRVLQLPLPAGVIAGLLSGPAS